MTDSLVVNTHAPTYVRYFLLLYHYDTHKRNYQDRSAQPESSECLTAREDEVLPPRAAAVNWNIRRTTQSAISSGLISMSWDCPCDVRVVIQKLCPMIEYSLQLVKAADS